MLHPPNKWHGIITIPLFTVGGKIIPGKVFGIHKFFGNITWTLTESNFKFATYLFLLNLPKSLSLYP